jgi:hypothetical protein
MTNEIYGKDYIISNSKLINFVKEWQNNYYTISIL